MVGCSTTIWWALHEYCEPDPLLTWIPLPFVEPQVCMIHFWSWSNISIGNHDTVQIFAHGRAGRATSSTREEASLAVAFHGAVICI